MTESNTDRMKFAEEQLGLESSVFIIQQSLDTQRSLSLQEEARSWRQDRQI